MSQSPGLPVPSERRPSEAALAPRQRRDFASGSPGSSSVCVRASHAGCGQTLLHKPRVPAWRPVCCTLLCDLVQATASLGWERGSAQRSGDHARDSAAPGEADSAGLGPPSTSGFFKPRGLVWVRAGVGMAVPVFKWNP